MKNFLKILILPVVIVMMLGFTPKALAVVDLMTVIFENAPLPLFGEVNFLPGDSKDGDATVTNNTETTQNVYAESVDGFDPDDLGSQLYLKVFENANPVPVYQDEFDNFLTAGPVPLSSLGGGTTKTYTFEVSFINSADNDYQGKSLGFDLCIGFSGGTFQCGDTVIGDEEPVDENDPPGGVGDGGGQIPGGSGGGSSGGFIQLIISNESVSSIDEDTGTAIITWSTNRLATSQVIYGPTPPSYTLDLNAVNFGYAASTTEDTIKVINHSVLVTGLITGQTYVYRVVSRASPPTVSVEHTFTMPTTGTIGNLGIAQANEIPVEQGLEQEPFLLNTESTSTEEAVAEETGEDNSNLLAFALGGLNFGLPGLICVGVALLIFLVFLGLIWLIYQNKKDKPLSREVAWLVAFGLIVSAILWFIPYTCPIIPLWVVIAIYVIWKLITRRAERVGV